MVFTLTFYPQKKVPLPLFRVEKFCYKLAAKDIKRNTILRRFQKGAERLHEEVL